MNEIIIAFVYMSIILNVVTIVMLLKVMNLLKSLGTTDKPQRDKAGYKKSFFYKLGKAMSEVNRITNNEDTDDDIVSIYENAEYKKLNDDDFYDDGIDIEALTKRKPASITNKKIVEFESNSTPKKKEVLDGYIPGVFHNINEFMAYVSARNLNVINTITGTKRTVKYLDPYNDGNGPTVMITFSDGTRGVFAPDVYAKAI